DGADRVEAAQVVTRRRQVAVPRDDVERAVIELRRPERALKLLHDLVLLIEIFVPSDRHLEVARVREPVRADRPELGDAERSAVVFADISTRRAADELDAKSHAARDQDDVTGRGGQPAELGRDTNFTLLRDDQELAVAALE